MDIIDETGPDVVSRLNQDFVFRMQASPGAGNVKSLERLWSSQSNEVRTPIIVHSLFVPFSIIVYIVDIVDIFIM
jgi:hypothetical protein